MQEFIICPICDEQIRPIIKDGTAIWSCPVCPFIGFEFYGEIDLQNLTSYINKDEIILS